MEALAAAKAEQSSGLQAKQSPQSVQWIFYFFVTPCVNFEISCSKACTVFIHCGFTATSVIANLDTEICSQLETDC